MSQPERLFKTCFEELRRRRIRSLKNISLRKYLFDGLYKFLTSFLEQKYRRKEETILFMKKAMLKPNKPKPRKEKIKENKILIVREIITIKLSNEIRLLALNLEE
jgi:hypothetical protein